MAEGQSPLDGILEENAAKEKEAKPLGQTTSPNHKSSTDEPVTPDPRIRQLRDVQASDSKYIAERLKQLEAMVMALRMLVGVTALAAAYSVWKVRKIENSLDPKKALKRGKGSSNDSYIEVEATAPQAVQTFEVDS